MTVDNIIDGVMLFCQGATAFMAKFDVEHAYHIVPVHPDDRYLLGMQWKGKYLPFGLHSVSHIFS